MNIRKVAMISVVSVCLLPDAALAADWWSTASYLGGPDGGSVPTAAILSDGTVVLGAVLGGASPGGVASTQLNGASEASAGAVVRLSPDGKSVLSVTRVGDAVRELAVDGEDNIVVAALAGGLIKLDPGAATLLWARTEGAAAFRVDVAPGGAIAALWDTGSPDAVAGEKGAAGKVTVHAADGSSIGGFSVQRGDGGTNDLAIDPGGQTVFVGGYKNTSQNGGLTVPFIVAYSPDGAQKKWVAYDYSYADVFASSDVADSFVSRLHFGADGRLYALGYMAGGNTVFRRDPLALAEMVELDAIDQYNEGGRFGGDANRGFYGRYEADSGAFAGGALYAAIDPDPATPYNKSALFLFTDEGDIKTDGAGRVYLVAAKNGRVLPYSFDPLGLLTGEGSNGAALTILSPDLKERLYVTSFVNTGPGGRGHAVAVRQIAGVDGQSIVYSGRMNVDANTGDVFLKEPLQPAPAGMAAGWFGVAAAAPFPGVPWGPEPEGTTGDPGTDSTGDDPDTGSTGDDPGPGSTSDDPGPGNTGGDPTPTSGAGESGPGNTDNTGPEGGESTGGAASEGDTGCGCRGDTHPRLSGLLVLGVGLLARRRRVPGT